MKTKLIFGCLFAALSTACVYADEIEPPKEEYFRLGDKEPTENEYVFAFADKTGVSYQLTCGCCDETVASTDEEPADEPEAKETSESV